MKVHLHSRIKRFIIQNDSFPHPSALSTIAPLVLEPPYIYNCCVPSCLPTLQRPPHASPFALNKPIQSKRILPHSSNWPHSLLLLTEVKHPLLRACSTSAALMAAGKHTHARTHRTSRDPIYLHKYVYLYMKREEEECCYFRTPGLKRTFG
jgi:hypothetical protein